MSRQTRRGAPKRTITSRAVRKELLVFVEGARTEANYLTAWHREYRDTVTVTIDPFHGGPLQLVERAIEAMNGEGRDARRGRGRAHDEYWCMFDHDEHPNVPDALSKALGAGVGVAFSNPCVELWFLLHFRTPRLRLPAHHR